MSEIDPKRFHRLYGVKETRIAYQARDFPDYVLMTLLTFAAVYVSYGPRNPMTFLGLGLCVFMVCVFPVRHGFGARLPLLLRRPQDVLYLFVYKLQNARLGYLLAIAALALENYFVYLTPGLPHHVMLMRTIAVWLFFIHFVGICLYRTVILVAHLRQRALVHEVLMQTTWKGRLSRGTGVVLEIVHAYVTGLLAHMVLIAPWYLVITHVKFSVLALPAACIVNLLIYFKHIRSYSHWFYRDHWLGHNSQLDFLYLHGPHHDAIPSGLIGVSGNGHLEGFLRHSLGVPTAFYNPVMACLAYSLEIQQDIQNHQYIPGVFPKLPRGFHETCQHSTHHYGRLEPYSIALNFPLPDRTQEPAGRFQLIPDEALVSIRLDEELTGFKWDNSRYRHFLELFDKYQRRDPP